MEFFIKDMNEISSIGAVEGKGRTRLSLSDTDAEARKWLLSKMRELELDVRIDRLGNMTGILPGENGTTDAPVTVGSHLDTVIEGGAFDGAYGIVGGLSVIRHIKSSGIKNKRPIALVNFTNEEGVRFSPGMTGSSFMAGKSDADEKLNSKDANGVSVGDELKRIGFDGKSEPLKPSKYLELHIEQGPRLEENKKLIGIVEGIAGIASWKIDFIGQASHAGAFPMNLRQDALAGMADCSVGLRNFIATINGAVGTIGKVSAFPGAINVVPGVASFTIDARTTGDKNFSELKIGVEKVIHDAANKNGLKVELKQMANVAPISFPKEITSLIEKCAAAETAEIMSLPSGAFHDAQFMYQICPTGMIFVPSIKGLSHCPQENTKIEDLWLGVLVLRRAILELAS